MKETQIMREKKARNLAKLTEKYYGKKDLMAEWELYPELSALEHEYLLDLARRIRGHQNDLAYRGVDGFTEFAGNGAVL